MSSDEMDDLPDPLAELDQGLAGLVMRAKILRHFHMALLEEGFEAAEALQLTRDYASKFTL